MVETKERQSSIGTRTCRAFGLNSLIWHSQDAFKLGYQERLLQILERRKDSPDAVDATIQLVFTQFAK